MAKNVFRAHEVRLADSKVFVQLPERDVPALAVPELELEEYAGPTADDLRREAELFRQQWETEKEQLVSAAREDADRIVKEAENLAFEEVRTKSEHAQSLKNSAEEDAERIRADAREEAERILREARDESSETERNAYEEGFARGRDEGYAQGQAEVERLIERLHVIINRTIERRQEIIEESESQLIHLVLEIARKVVKVISENQKNIVVNNVAQALRKLKSRADVTIRVNIDDLNLVSGHAKDFIDRIERVQNISVLEDSTVDRGGCIIETDFGQIDARIASQLREIEDRILELVPITERRKKIRDTDRDPVFDPVE
ncbi:MAG: flagellar assembly protein FliH [Spirochaetaceae bacterium]|nr:MAG: flagellar assembly protein FliH [Spirochaetaceae bacterium]